jgi:putative acetyltransferase
MTDIRTPEAEIAGAFEAPVEIHSEGLADEAAIRELLIAAFGGSAEATLMDRLRDHGAVVVSLVAVAAGRIVGYIAFSRLWVENAQRLTPAVALAPLAVHPDFQNRGLAGRLIEAGHDQLRLLRERLSVVLGEPGYYGRFGYSREAARGFASPYPPEYLSALAFLPSAPETGTLRYDHAFEGL